MDELNQIVDKLVMEHGIEDVVIAVAQSALNQAERMGNMGHDSSKVMEIADALSMIVEEESQA